MSATVKQFDSIVVVTSFLKPKQKIIFKYIGGADIADLAGWIVMR